MGDLKKHWRRYTRLLGKLKRITIMMLFHTVNFIKQRFLRCLECLFIITLQLMTAWKNPLFTKLLKSCFTPVSSTFGCTSIMISKLSVVIARWDPDSIFQLFLTMPFQKLWQCFLFHCKKGGFDKNGNRIHISVFVWISVQVLKYIAVS